MSKPNLKEFHTATPVNGNAHPFLSKSIHELKRVYLSSKLWQAVPDGSLGDCEVMYIVSRNMQICNRDLCRVTCEKFPPGHCLHEFICSCEYYSYRNMCSHTHLVCRHISGADSCGEAPTAGIEAATVEIQSREEDHDNSSVQVTIYWSNKYWVEQKCLNTFHHYLAPTNIVKL